MSEQYNVIFKGEVLEGFDLEQVQQSFAKTFKLNLEKAEKYFTGQSHTIRKKLDHKTAYKFKTVFENFGASVELERIAPEKTSVDSLSLVPMEEKGVEEQIVEEYVNEAPINRASEPSNYNQVNTPVEVEYVENEGTPWLMYLGYACYAFAIADFGLYLLDIADLTGVSWSPIAAGMLGSLLVKMSGSE